MRETDSSLVQKSVAGDRDAFGVLMDRYIALVHGVILEKLRRPEDVEDLVQETFTKAYQGLASLREPAKFAPWTCRVAANLALDWLQRQQRRLRVEQEDRPLAIYAPAPDQLHEDRERTAVLWEALDHLPPEYRRVIVLHHLEGCTQREIARFTDLPLTTVKWRLYRARSRLQLELTEIFGQEIGHRSRDQQRSREKILAALPLVAFFPTDVPASLSRWTRRALAGIGVAGTLGLAGIAFDAVPLPDMGLAGEGDGEFRVRYEPQELPAISVTTWPRTPQAGERVELEVAGYQPGDGESAFLHYITDLDEPVDRVVEMRPEGETWIAEMTIPAEAADIYFYVDADRDPLRYDWDGPSRSWFDERQRYSTARMIYDDAGRPVRGAEFGIGKWAALQERPGEEILAHYHRELSRFPDHWEVYPRRWSVLQWTDELSAGFDRVQREKEALRERFPDDPDLAQLVIDRWDTSRLRAFAARFPQHEKAAGAAYRATLRPFDDWEGRTAALLRFLQDFPRSPYIDDAYRDLLTMYDRIDRGRGKALADSLISGDLVPYFDLEQERIAETILWSGNWQGALPEGKAYVLRFEWYMEEGDTTAAVKLAGRLAASGLRDPIPFVSIGRQLADGTGHHDVAAELLQSGLVWLTEEHMLQLPTFVLDSRSSMFSREGMRRYRRENVQGWRVKCLHSLGQIRLDQRDYEAAALHLGEAAELQREHGHTEPELDIYLKLGEASVELGDCAGAIEAYMDVVRLNYHHSGAEAALKRLYQGECGRQETLAELLTSAYTEAPGFRAADVNDDTLGLADFRGSVVAMYYDESQWREEQARELDVLAGWHDRFHSAGLRVIYLAVPSVYHPNDGQPPYSKRDQIVEAVREGGYSFPVAFDDDRVGRSKYGLRRAGGRVLFLIDRLGRLRLRQVRAWDDAEMEPQNRVAIGLLTQLLAEYASSEELPPGVAGVHAADRDAEMPRRTVEVTQ